MCPTFFAIPQLSTILSLCTVASLAQSVFRSIPVRFLFTLSSCQTTPESGSASSVYAADISIRRTAFGMKLRRMCFGADFANMPGSAARCRRKAETIPLKPWGRSILTRTTRVAIGVARRRSSSLAATLAHRVRFGAQQDFPSETFKARRPHLTGGAPAAATAAAAAAAGLLLVRTFHGHASWAQRTTSTNASCTFARCCSRWLRNLTPL